MKKTKEITTEIVQDTYIQRILFRFLVGSLMSLSVFYIYMIGSITFNVIARKSLENTQSKIGSNISQLELTYLSNMNDINKSRASSLGFVDSKSNIFATRNIIHVAIR
jgi:hypothetical protein